MHWEALGSVTRQHWDRPAFPRWEMFSPHPCVQLFPCGVVPPNHILFGYGPGTGLSLWFSSLRALEIPTCSEVWGLKPLLVPNSAWGTVLPQQQGCRGFSRKESQHDLSLLE